MCPAVRNPNYRNRVYQNSLGGQTMMGFRRETVWGAIVGGVLAVASCAICIATVNQGRGVDEPTIAMNVVLGTLCMGPFVFAFGALIGGVLGELFAMCRGSRH